MDIVETLRVWATMSVKKMIVTGFFVLALGAVVLYDTVGDRVTWESRMTVSSLMLEDELKITPFEYLGVYQYGFLIPFTVKEVNKACASDLEMCYMSKDYFLHQDLIRTKYHMQNLCEVYGYPKGDPKFNMKVIGTCPVIIDKQLKGYVMTTATLNADHDDMVRFLRKVANKVAGN